MSGWMRELLELLTQRPQSATQSKEEDRKMGNEDENIRIPLADPEPEPEPEPAPAPPVFMRSASTVIYQTYQCRRCGATDTDKRYPNEMMPPCFNCWQCSAGRGMQLQDMVQKHIGMFPVLSAEPATVQ